MVYLQFKLEQKILKIISKPFTMFCKCKMTDVFKIKLKLTQINITCSGRTIAPFKCFRE